MSCLVVIPYTKYYQVSSQPPQPSSWQCGPVASKCVAELGILWHLFDIFSKAVILEYSRLTSSPLAHHFRRIWCCNEWDVFLFVYTRVHMYTYVYMHLHVYFQYQLVLQHLSIRSRWFTMSVFLLPDLTSWCSGKPFQTSRPSRSLLRWRARPERRCQWRTVICRFQIREIPYQNMGSAND